MTAATIKDCTAIGLYADGELDVVASLAFEAHAATCDTCKHDLAAFGVLRNQLQRDLVRYTADDALRGRISSAIAGTSEPVVSAPASVLVLPTPRRLMTSRWLSLVAAGFFVAVLSSSATLYFGRPSPETLWIDGIAASHERAMLSGHVFDVASSNRHVVKPWFSGKTAIAPPVIDLGNAGYPLVGGRLDVPLREPMPALIYRAGPHFISVYVRPSEGEEAPRLTKIDGFSILHWRHHGFAFYAISDADGAEIGKFQKAYAAKLSTLP